MPSAFSTKITMTEPSSSPQRTLLFNQIWDGVSWHSPGYVTLDASGTIIALGNEANKEIKVEHVEGIALPGMPNAHSHAFQYAMAGAAENLPPQAKGDNFWSWRDEMYRLALSVSPDDVETISSMLYAEMVAVGYTHVAEFHYLHHNTDGTPYTNIAEMGERLIRAAQKAGIRITLVPIYYQQGGFNAPARDDQRRFLSSNRDNYYKLWEATQQLASSYPHVSLGVGVHSLRAVPEEDVIATLTELAPHLPRHIHVAEQLKEVDDCLAHWGKRPVEWLLDNIPLDASYHLVHATHMTPDEYQRTAKSGAHVVLCPTTEGNLGDGRFDLVQYRSFDGNWSIGTDSHIGLLPNEELRLLDYTQRLDRHERNVLCTQGGQQSGNLAYKEALSGGQAAMGIQIDGPTLSVGQPFDAVVYDAASPRLVGVTQENLLSTIVYACDSRSLLGTLTQGQWRAKRGTHLNTEIRKEYARYKRVPYTHLDT